MDITSVTGTRTAALSSLPPTPPAAGSGGAFEAVSSLLGMSASDIATQVQSGASLDDLATAAGVSHDDLVSALKEGAPEELKTSADFDSVIEHIASQSGAERPAGPPPPPPSGSGVLSGNLTSSQQSALDAVSELLDVSSDELATELQSGADLAALLADKGVDLTTLADTLEKGFLVDLRA